MQVGRGLRFDLSYFQTDIASVNCGGVGSGVFVGQAADVFSATCAHVSAQTTRQSV